MRRQGAPYNSDPPNQPQQYNNYVASGNAYPAQSDPLRPGDAYNYAVSSRPSESRWSWDPNSTKDPNLTRASYPPGYAEGQGNLAQQAALYDAQKQPNSDPNAQNSVAMINKVQIGYGDNNNNNNNIIINPQTIEGLEQKFLQDISILSKEHNDAEDAEINRHRERLNEITTQYHEKLAAKRAHHSKQREELMRNEAQSRYQQYNNTNQYQNRSSPTPHPPPPLPSGAPPPHHNYPPGFGAETQQRTATYPPGYGGEVQQPRAPYPAPGTGHYESGGYGYESRGQYPGGRAYNAGAR